MRKLLVLGLGVLAYGCAQVAVESSVGRACTTAWDCLTGESCGAGQCTPSCSVDADCDVGSCVPHAVGPRGWCNTGTVENETSMSQSETLPSRDPSPAPPVASPTAHEPPAPPPEPEDDTDEPPAPPAQADNDSPSPSPLLLQTGDPDPASEPQAHEEPEAEPEAEPEPAPRAQEESAPRPACTYPAGAGNFGLGSVIPRLSWRGAYWTDGTRFDFDFETFHCNTEFQRYSVLVVIVGAEWCGACTDYMRALAREAGTIDAAGGLLLYVETQDYQTNWIGNERANRVINGHMGNAPGVRVGDGDTEQGPGTVYNSPIVESLPTTFAVRRADMTIIEKDAYDWAAVARREWNGGSSVDEGRPEDCMEEIHEPNNNADAAGTLRAGDRIQGGICDGSPDFYRVQYDGEWTLDLTFRHAVGDIDVYVWDPFTDGVLVDAGGFPVGSDSVTDGEAFTFFGEQIVVVLGYDGARAPYQLHLNGQ